jgi:pre-rRNA-processing protein TSR4
VWEDEQVDGVHLCSVCGNPAPSSCSRCHARRYCSKQHQLYDWKNGHKAACTPKTDAASSTPSSSSSQSITLSSLLFPQKEILIEPELDEEDQEAEEHKAKSKETKLTKEAQLLAAYEKEKAESKDDEEEEEDLTSAVSSWHSPKLKDPLFLKFKLRTADKPEQVLRYNRAPGKEGKTQPMWVSNWYQPASPPIAAEQLQAQKPASDGKKAPPPPRPIAPTNEQNEAAIPACQSCGSARRFEFQVLPQLLYYFGRSSSVLDFANLVVYTCENTCGEGTKHPGYVEEYTWVQAHAQ